MTGKEIYIEVNNRALLMRVGIAKDLPYPILLGTDMPILPDLVPESAWCGMVTRAKSGRREGRGENQKHGR